MLSSCFLLHQNLIDLINETLFIELGVKGDNRCTFYPGDGVGGTEFKVGMQTDSQCVDACLAKKKTDDSINGVTILSNNKPGCWCERSMRGRNYNPDYKSCFIGDTGRISILYAFFF